MVYFWLFLGLVLLLVGGDGLVRGAVAIAARLGLSPLLIGIVLVGFGTSTPELLTSVQAALAGSPGIAVGNVVGSNTANILLILAVAALIRPMQTNPAAFYRDGTAMMGAALACLAVVLVGELSRLAGIGLVLGLLAYVGYTYARERMQKDTSALMHAAEAELVQPVPARLWIAVLMAIGGLALTMLGASFLVGSAIEIAGTLGVPDTVIGLTIVAVGTSLPELVASIIAALRRQGDLAFGNIVGSNIYNVLGILGLTALLRPLPVPPEIATFDIWVMLGATVLLLGFALTGFRLNRIEGGVMLALYSGYLFFLARTAGT